MEFGGGSSPVGSEPPDVPPGLSSTFGTAATEGSADVLLFPMHSVAFQASLPAPTVSFKLPALAEETADQNSSEPYVVGRREEGFVESPERCCYDGTGDIAAERIRIQCQLVRPAT